MFTGVIHRDNWQRFLDIVLPQLLEPGLRAEDFKRLKTRQQNALVQDLRSNNEEELGKERLQTNIFRGTPYGHVALGTEAGLRSITLDDVKAFARQAFTRANLTVGISGDAPDELVRELRSRLSALPDGAAALRAAVAGVQPKGIEVEILEKDTRATAISFGFPIDVTRAHADFAALSVARAWLGEHRLSSGRLYQRIREERGINYGDYAYIEAFPRGMFQFFPDSNVARRQPDLRNLDPSRRACQRAHDAEAGGARADQPGREGPDAGRLRRDARLPDEERVRHDGAPGSAAGLRARLEVVRHRRVHRPHALAGSRRSRSSRSTPPSNATSTPATCPSSSSPRMRPG